MGKKKETAAKPNPKKPATWEETDLTPVEKSQAHYLVEQLKAGRKLEPQTNAVARKRNLARVIGGMAMENRQWDKFKNTEISHKAKKYTALSKLV